MPYTEQALLREDLKEEDRKKLEEYHVSQTEKLASIQAIKEIEEEKRIQEEAAV